MAQWFMDKNKSNNNNDNGNDTGSAVQPWPLTYIMTLTLDF